jgi:RHS repeat-associated protein
MTGWTSKTSGQKRTIVWNEENRIKSITDGGSTEFLYDDTGERVIKRGDHGETAYINRFYSVKNGDLGSKHVFAGETRIVTKLEKNGGSITSGVPGSIAFTVSQGLQNAILQGSGQKKGINRRLQPTQDCGNDPNCNPQTSPPTEKFQFFYHGDHLGSSSFITDDAGSVYQHLEYFPYGETWIEEGGSYGGNTPGYKFTGKELDPETGLYYYGARYYDPVLSRWISADPALEKFLPTGNKDRDQNLPGIGGVFNPVNLSVYAYGHNNPVRTIDPDGRDALIVTMSLK